LLCARGQIRPRLRSTAGDTADTAYDFVTGLLGATVGDLDENVRRAALANLREAVRAHATPDGVLFGSAMWVVPATVA